MRGRCQGFDAPRGEANGDGVGMMLAFELVDGRALEQAIEKLFATPNAEYLHVHFAAPGCYAARVERA